MILEVQCVMCKEVHKIEVDEEAFKLWQGGMLIQWAMPSLSVELRELLTSRTCGKCFVGEPWRQLFALTTAMPLIIGLTALPHMRTTFGFVMCEAGIVYTLVLLFTCIVYIHSGRK